MNPFRRVISASLSPNTNGDDVLRAIKMLFMPFIWEKGQSVRSVERWFEHTFDRSHAVSFNSGRSALLGILKAFQIGRGDEVLLQSFTCVAVPNSVLWADATPVFVDIDSSLNFSVSDAEGKITSKTRALIVQHTFGNPADMDRILDFAKKHKLIVIEDCAHSLGAFYRGNPVGSFGDAAFFSFGRDKVISSVFGGLAIIKNIHKSTADKLISYRDSLPAPSGFWIFQQLLHPVVFSVILPLYTSGIGKGLLILFQKLRLLSFPVYPQEKKGVKPTDFPKKYPNALAYLSELQLQKIDRLNAHRKDVARFYKTKLRESNIRTAHLNDGSISLRFPVFVDTPDKIILKARKEGILLGNWYHNTIDPAGVEFQRIGYKIHSCPKAEEAAGRIINLPTNISMDEAMAVAAQIT